MKCFTQITQRNQILLYHGNHKTTIKNFTIRNIQTIGSEFLNICFNNSIKFTNFATQFLENDIQTDTPTVFRFF